jgi:hypothetical protein
MHVSANIRRQNSIEKSAAYKLLLQGLVIAQHIKAKNRNLLK